MKVCSKCGVEKELSEFNKKRGTKDGVRAYCRDCHNRLYKEYYAKNREAELARERKKYAEDAEFRATCNAKSSAYYFNNKDVVIERTGAYYQSHKEAMRINARQRRAQDPEYRLSLSLRARCHAAIIRGAKSASTQELVGAPIDIVRKHLELLFKDGMSWGNYGKYGWHVDHIRPCSSFNLEDPVQQRECFHYTNLQPLWWWVNISKGAKWDGNARAPDCAVV